MIITAKTNGIISKSKKLETLHNKNDRCSISDITDICHTNKIKVKVASLNKLSISKNRKSIKYKR